MTDELDRLCKHTRLVTKWWVKAGRAIVSCVACGFTVEVTGENLNEFVLKAEFNLAVRKALVGQRIFPVSN